MVDRTDEQPTKDGFWLGPFVYTGEWDSKSIALIPDHFIPAKDIKSAEQVLKWVEEGKVKIKTKRLLIPSPFALNLVLQGRSDLIKMEDRASFLRRMHELHLKAIGNS